MAREHLEVEIRIVGLVGAVLQHDQPRIADRELLADHRPVPRAQAAEPAADHAEAVDDHPGRRALERHAEQVEPPPAAMLEGQPVRPLRHRHDQARRVRRLDRGGRRGRCLPRPVVDAEAQHAVVRRGLVQDLELADGAADRAVGAGLDPQLRALAIAVDADAADAERLLGAARAPDRGPPRPARAVADPALVVVTGAGLARGDQAAARVPEPRGERDAQPPRHRVPGGVRVPEHHHHGAPGGRAGLARAQPGEQVIERAHRRVEGSGGLRYAHVRTGRDRATRAGGVERASRPRTGRALAIAAAAAPEQRQRRRRDRERASAPHGAGTPPSAPRTRHRRTCSRPCARGAGSRSRRSRA